MPHSYPFTAADLEALRDWDTPTICNAIEVVAPHRRGRGFSTTPFTAANPGLRPICGLARTGQIRAAQPSGRNRDGDREARIGWYEYVARAAMPTIVVIEDIDALFGKDRASKNAKSPLSFSGLLNALDGVGAASGQVPPALNRAAVAWR